MKPRKETAYSSAGDQGRKIHAKALFGQVQFKRLRT
jgi:hypothetical protein